MNIDDFYSKLQDNNTKSQTSKGNPNAFQPVPKEGGANIYLVKLVPNTEDPAQTFVQYSDHGWMSSANGRYVVAGLCGRSIPGSDRCTICGAGYDSYKTGELQKDGKTLKSKLLLPRTHNLTNLLIIDDPVNPENNGTVKVLRYSTGIHNIITNALFGDDKDDIGGRAFDYSKDGAVLKIVCERKGGKKDGLPTYERSKFVGSGSFSMTKEKAKEVFAQAHDLTTFLPKAKAADEIASILAQHFHATSKDPSNQPLVPREDSFQLPNTPINDMGEDNGQLDPEIAALLNGIGG